MGIRNFQRKKKPVRRKKSKDTFYRSNAWKELRYEKLRTTQYCECCGKKKNDRLENGERVKLTIDHIKPRSKYPELSLDITNLQVLCQSCNSGKSNLFNDDWREDKEEHLFCDVLLSDDVDDYDDIRILVFGES